MAETLIQKIDKISTIKTNLRDTIVAKGGVLTDKTFADYATVIGTLVDGKDSQITSLNQQVTNLTADASTKDATLNTYTADLGDIRTTIVTLGGTVPEDTDYSDYDDCIKTLVEAKNTEISNLTSDKTALQGQVETLTSDKATLTSEKEALETDMSTIESKVDAILA